jgi:hypothetical protein
MSLGRCLGVLLFVSALTACPGGGPGGPTDGGSQPGDSGTSSIPVLPEAASWETTAGVPFERSLSAAGGTGELTYSAQALPAGLVLDARTGRLSGTPSIPGRFELDISVRDSAGRGDQKRYVLLVLQAPGFVTSSLPEALAGSAYASRLEASGGKPPLTYSASAGTLPPGLSLDSSGALSGTPSTPGTFSFEASVTDAHGAVTRASFTIEVLRGLPPLAITTTALPDAYRGSPYPALLEASGGLAPYLWDVVTGTLPPGVELGADGRLSGVPTASGTFSFTARVADSRGKTSSQALTVTSYLPPAVSAKAMKEGYAGESYDDFFSAAEGKAPYTFTVSAGTVPQGLTLHPNGVLQGTPTAPGTPSFEVTASDVNGRTSARSFSVSIYAPVVLSSVVPEARYGQFYSHALSVSGGKPGYTFALVSGAPPPGISLSSSGLLSGTPAGSSASFTVRVSDVNNRATAQVINLTVRAPPSDGGTTADGGSLPDAGTDGGSVPDAGTDGGTQPGAGGTFTLAHWNIEWFGSDTNGPPRSTSPGGSLDDLQIANARSLVLDAGVNLWGLVEITDGADFQALVAQLPGYAGFLSDDPRVSLGPDYYGPTEQKVGVLYDSRLTYQSATLILTSFDNDFAGRPPLRVDFLTRINGVNSPLTVIVLHMKAFADQTSYDRRQRAGAALKNYLDALPSSRVFVVGDWNDDVDQSITFSGGIPLPSPYESFNQDFNDYAFVTRPLSLSGETSTTGFSDMIDHTLATDDVLAHYLPGSVHVLRPGWITDYSGTTSDHYPVLSRYGFGPPPPPLTLTGPTGGTYAGETW